MKANHVKARILPILDEMIAYLRNKSRILKKSAARKFYFSTTSSEKIAKFEDFSRNNCVFTKTIAKKLHVGKKMFLQNCVFTQL